MSFIDRIVFNIYKIPYTYAIFSLLVYRKIAIVVIVPKFIMQKICFDIWDK